MLEATKCLEQRCSACSAECTPQSLTPLPNGHKSFALRQLDIEKPANLEIC